MMMILIVLGSFVACSKQLDSGESCDCTSPPLESGDSCWVGDSICFDYDGDTESWCAERKVQYAHVIEVEYSASPCPGDEVAYCPLSQGYGDLTDAGATAYYYTPDYSTASAESACICAGGVFLP